MKEAILRGMNEPELKIEQTQGAFVVSEDKDHITENALSCVIYFPIIKDGFITGRDRLFLCFHETKNEEMLNTARGLHTYGFDWHFSLKTQNWQAEPKSRKLPGMGDEPLHGVLLSPEDADACAIEFLHVELKGLVNFYIGDAPLYLYKISGKNCNQVCLQSVSKLQIPANPVEILSFQADRTIVPYGESVTLSWKLKGAAKYMLKPFDKGFSNYIPVKREEKIFEPIQATLCVKDDKGNAQSKDIDINVRHILKINKFEIATAYYDGADNIKMFDWEIEYTGQRIAITVKVDGKDIFPPYTDLKYLKNTEYIDVLYNESAELHCEGDDGVTDTAKIQKG